MGRRWSISKFIKCVKYVFFSQMRFVLLFKWNRHRACRVGGLGGGGGKFEWIWVKFDWVTHGAPHDGFDNFSTVTENLEQLKKITLSQMFLTCVAPHSILQKHYQNYINGQKPTFSSLHKSYVFAAKTNFSILYKSGRRYVVIMIVPGHV